MSRSHIKERHPTSGEQRETSDVTNDPTGSPKQWPGQVIGVKYVRLLEKQLNQLRDETAHGNQRLFLDDVFVVYLLAFFNPIVRSLRTVEDLSQTRQAQKHLSVERICKSTLSDFNSAIDRPLTDEDRAAGIISDRVGYFASDNARRAGV